MVGDIRDVFYLFPDLFKWDLIGALSGDDDDDDEIAKREDEDGSSQSTCTCDGPKCDCCVDFNISSIIDFGGPGKKTKNGALSAPHDSVSVASKF